MSGLTVVTELHTSFRAPVCCLCVQSYDEQYVAAVLLWDGLRLGEICPRCLNQRPGDLVGKVLRHSAAVRGLGARIRERSERLRRDSEVLRAESLDAREQLRKTIEESHRLLNDRPPTTTELAPLAAEIAALDVWPVSLDELIALERRVFRQKYSYLTDDDLAFIVDDRYKMLLW